MSIVLLQSSVTGYTSEATTLYGAMDTDRGALLIEKDGKFSDAVKKDFLKVSNIGGNDVSIVFNVEHFREAIQAWREMEAMGKVKLGDRVGRHNPASKLQVSKVSEAGPLYEISQDISNGQIAALAMVWFARKQVAMAAAADFSEMVATTLYRVSII